MKILVVAPNVDMGVVKGDTVHLRNVLRYWSRDHRIHLVAPTDEADCPEGVERLATIDANYDFVPNYVERTLKSFAKTFSLVASNDYDAVYERHHLFGSGVFGSVLASCPTVLEVNGSLVGEHEIRDSISPATAKALRALERVIVRLSDRVVCVSPKVADQFRCRGISEAKLSIIANGCDPAEFHPVPDAKARLSWDEDVTHLGFVGSLTRWHGVERLVEALPEVLADRPQTELVVVGDGPLREPLAERVREDGLDDHVRFVGRVPHEEVPLYMSAFDAGAILKHPDIPGSPLKLYEYLACGTPVVATDDADFEIVGAEAVGETANYHDSADIARAILSVLDSDGEMAQRARRTALDHSWEKVAERVLNAIPR